jgi:hypothetical protein
MRTQQLAGWLFVAGFVLVIAASVVFPFTFYTAEDEQARQAILDANRGGWIATNALFIASALLTALAVALVARAGRQAPALAGAGLFAVGSAFWVAYAYLRIGDASLSQSLLWMEEALGWLSAGGLLLLGLAYLPAGLPAWIGYVNAGYAALFVLAFILMGEQPFMANFAPQLPFLLAQFTGVAAIRHNQRVAAVAANAA